jgi:hypothetical protein
VTDRPLAVVDLDGVVADVRHRLHFVERRPKDWDGFFDAARGDPPHEEGLAVVRRLAEDHDVVYLTGRPERCRRDTEAWLDKHGIGGHPLHMRPGGQRTPAAVLKVELLRRLSRGRRVGVVVDDDPAVVDAMTAAGFPVFQATWERRLLDAEEESALRVAQEIEGRS